MGLLLNTEKLGVADATPGFSALPRRQEDIFSLSPSPDGMK
jgi:hypothetical protein